MVYPPCRGNGKFPFLESFDYNNGKPVEIGTDGTLVLENPYIDINGQTISFQNAEVSVVNTEELDKTIMVNENGKTLTLSNVVPGTITLTATYDFQHCQHTLAEFRGNLES